MRFFGYSLLKSDFLMCNDAIRVLCFASRVISWARFFVFYGQDSLSSVLMHIFEFRVVMASPLANDSCEPYFGLFIFQLRLRLRH